MSPITSTAMGMAGSTAAGGDHRERVVIIGGGFGGLYTAQALRRAPLEVTLVDRRNFHLFQPLLYQVATGGLSPANIASPLRSVLRRQRNTTVLLGEMVDLDPQRSEVVLREGRVRYDHLIIATGSQTGYFGHDAWQHCAPGLKTLEDAALMRSRVLSAFEAAEQEPDPHKVAALLTFVIVGGGPTGVELAGALAEVANYTLRHDFRRINPSDARILLIERSARVLDHYPPDLSDAARKSLDRLGVSVRTGTSITDIRPDEVTVECGGKSERIKSATILWAAGVTASPMGRVLHDRLGAELDRMGRIKVQPDLSIAGHPNVFVIGDLAFLEQDGQPLPGVAPVAMQEGRYVAQLVAARHSGHALPAFRYRDRGSMATIGRAAAVAQIGRLHLTGYIAWLVWLFVHLMYIVQFANRVLVFFQWGYNYLTRNRPARLITNVVFQDSAPRKTTHPMPVPEIPPATPASAPAAAAPIS